MHTAFVSAQLLPRRCCVHAVRRGAPSARRRLNTRCCERRTTAAPHHARTAAKLAASRRRLDALRLLRDDVERRRRLRVAARPPYLTAVLWCVLAAVHLLALVSGTHAALVARCATGAATALCAEPWRALTAAAVHRGVPHLAANLAALAPLGTATEIVYGTPAFLSLTLCGAAAGATLSALVRTACGSQLRSVGASGALHALAGALLAHLALNRRALGVRQALTTGLALVAALVAGAAASCAAAAVDIWAHVGGLLGGIVVGALLSPRMQRRGNVALVRRASRRRASAVGIVVCAALYAALVVGVAWRHLLLLGGL